MPALATKQLFTPLADRGERKVLWPWGGDRVIETGALSDATAGGTALVNA